jgi:hypothetical protein
MACTVEMKEARTAKSTVTLAMDRMMLVEHNNSDGVVKNDRRVTATA